MVGASAGPVVVAESIESVNQIRTVADFGAWGSTIVGAVVDRRLVPGGPVVDHADEALRAASTA